MNFQFSILQFSFKTPNYNVLKVWLTGSLKIDWKLIIDNCKLTLVGGERLSTDG